MKKRYCLLFSIFLIFIFLFIAFPKEARGYAKNGIILCGEVIIPSLFPINLCVIFIMKIIGNNFNKGKLPLIFLFSLLGGYPTGAKLINEEYKAGSISKKTANLMQCCCTNAGLGFIVSAVGFGIYSSEKTGFLLLFCHCFSSFLLLVILRNKIKYNIKRTGKTCRNPADIFTLSASEAANTVLSVCSFVIFFSVVNGFLFSVEPLRFFCFFTEITTTLSIAKNIYLTAFLLSFGGISIWCQVISVSKECGVDFKAFLLSRLFCGGISALLMFLLVKIFKIRIAVFSNNAKIIGEALNSKPSVVLCLTLMIILLIISLNNKNNGGNLSDDLLK